LNKTNAGSLRYQSLNEQFWTSTIEQFLLMNIHVQSKKLVLFMRTEVFKSLITLILTNYKRLTLKENINWRDFS